MLIVLSNPNWISSISTNWFVDVKDFSPQSGDQLHTVCFCIVIIMYIQIFLFQYDILIRSKIYVEGLITSLVTLLVISETYKTTLNNNYIFFVLQRMKTVLHSAKKLLHRMNFNLNNNILFISTITKRVIKSTIF